MRLASAAFAALLLPLATHASPVDQLPQLSQRDAAADDAQANNTVFNGQEVPPIAELNGTTFKESISKGYWLVKAFSPYCGHCVNLAPKWQTIYEFYYTLNPLPASTEPLDPNKSLNSFSRYYNFNFGSLDCVANGDVCEDIEVGSWPTMVLFKDGAEFKRMAGDRSMEYLSKFIEEALETIRPGSRPHDGVKLPDVGAHEAPQQKALSSHGKNKPDPAPGAAGGFVKRPAKPTANMNPEGKSRDFTAETFESKVSKTQDPWFIKFYAPWCHHCQRMAASWTEMARGMRGKLNVGEVNCETERKLCLDTGVAAYPTIMYFQGPEHIEYEGLRSLGDFMEFANRAVDAAGGVQDVNSKEFEQLEETEEVIFTYFYDYATTNEDYMALERLPPQLIGHAKIVKTSDAELIKRFKIASFPRLIVSRDGKTSEYERRSPQDMRDVAKLTEWMKGVWQPLVPELSTQNAAELMRGKYVVLGVLTRERAGDFAAARRELKSAALEWMGKQAATFASDKHVDAKQLQIDEATDRADEKALRSATQMKIGLTSSQRTEVAFAWVDRVFWERWLGSTFGVRPGDADRVIINDQDKHRYWDLTPSGQPIAPSRTAILDTLAKTAPSPQLPAKTSGSGFVYLFWRADAALHAHPWLSAAAAAGTLLLGAAAWRRGRRRMQRGHRVRGRGASAAANGFFYDKEMGAGLLGNGAANGKVD